MATWFQRYQIARKNLDEPEHAERGCPDIPKPLSEINGMKGSFVSEEKSPTKCVSPPMRFSTRWLAERDRPGIWREEFGRRFVNLEVEQIDDELLLYDTTFQSHGDVSIATGELSAISCSRTKEMLGDGNSDIVILIPQSGPLHAEQGITEEYAEPGDCLVRRNSETGRTSLRAGGFLTLNLPVERLSERVADIDRLGMSVIQSRNPALQLLQAYCGVLIEKEIDMPSPLQDNVIGDHLLDLASVAIGANRDAWHTAQSGGVRAARRLAAQTAIRKNATNPAFRIGDLARGMNVSESYVRKLLAESGRTFSAILLEARLERVYAKLSDARFDGLMISQIALESGFNDISYFNRAFARKFDATPSAVRRERRKSVRAH